MSSTPTSEAYEGVAFKSVPAGFLFRAPTRWPFSRAKHYHVTAAQKAALVQALSRARGQSMAVGLLSIPLFVALGVAAEKVQGSSASFIGTVASSVLLGLLIAFAFTQLRWRAAHPIIADLHPSQETIRLRERLATFAAASPLWYHIVFGFLFALMAFDYAPIGGDRLHIWHRPGLDVGALGAWALTVALLGIASFLWTVVVFKIRHWKRRQGQRP
jgi:hypothetical protein